MWAKKAQYEYVTSDLNDHSHFTRIVQEGAKKGTTTGCKYEACKDERILPPFSHLKSTGLPEM